MTRRAALVDMLERHEFTEAEYRADPRRVIDHAVEHGRALVVRDDGSVRVAISIPRAEK